MRRILELRPTTHTRLSFERRVCPLSSQVRVSPLHNAVAPAAAWSNQPLHVCPSQTAATDGIETCHTTCQAMKVRKRPRLVSAVASVRDVGSGWRGQRGAAREARAAESSPERWGLQEGKRTWCRTATTALSTGCSRRSECCERSMGTRPPSDAAAMARCVGELCAPQNTRPRAKVYTVMRVASTRSARYLRGVSPEGGAWSGTAWAGWAAFGAAVRVVGAELGEAHGTMRAAGSRATHGPTRRRQRRAAPGREAEQHRLRTTEAPSRERQWAARREAASTRR